MKIPEINKTPTEYERSLRTDMTIDEIIAMFPESNIREVVNPETGEKEIEDVSFAAMSRMKVAAPPKEV